MAKNEEFGTNIDDMPYDEYVEKQKAWMEEDAKKEKEKRSAESDDGPKGVDAEGGYEPETFSEEGGYDDYLAEQGSSKGDSGKEGEKGEKGSGKSGFGGEVDETSQGSSSESSSSAEGAGGGISVLAGGEGTGTSMRAATAGETASGIGTKLVEGVKGMGNNLMKGLRGMFAGMGGGIAQMAQTLHVSAKVLTLAMALVGGGSITFLGITLFGDDNPAKYLSVDDCRLVSTIDYNIELTDNEVYHPMTQQGMDGNARTIYKALSSKDLIDGVIGYVYKVGVKEGAETGTGLATSPNGSSYDGYAFDPYYEDRDRTHENPTGGDGISGWYIGKIQDGFKYVGKEPNPDDVIIVPTAEDIANGLGKGDKRLVDVWIYDPHMGELMWSHGPATLKDTDDGATHKTVIPGKGSRLDFAGNEYDDVSTRIGAGLFPGLSDQRQQLHKGFTDEAILGMILNAEAESSVNPACWEAMNACYYYINVKGNNNPAKKIALATTHHRNWDEYVPYMFEQVYAASGMSINEDGYKYTDRWGKTTNEQGEQLYYPGIGLWQWTGERAYGMQEWNNMVLGLSDRSLDTSADSLYSMNSQIYYLLFENYATWDTTMGNKPKDTAEVERWAVDVNKADIVDKNNVGNRVSLIDWGLTERVQYKEVYWVNIPNRPGAENLYGRERLPIHTFNTLRELDQDNDEVTDNHDNLVRPQFDFVYEKTSSSNTYDDGDLTIRDAGGLLLRKVNLEKVTELYHMMLSHPKRPATHEGYGCMTGCDDGGCSVCNVRACTGHSSDHSGHSSIGGSSDSSKHSSDSICDGCYEVVPDSYGPDQEDDLSSPILDANGEETGEYEQKDVFHEGYTKTCECTIATSHDGPDLNGYECQDATCKLLVSGCKTYYCWHQCQLDSETNVRKMIANLMTTWRDSSGNIWWNGLEEADFLDVGSKNMPNASCGDMIFENNKLGDGYLDSYIKSSYSLTCYYVKWYYDLSVEVSAMYSNGSHMYDVDNMDSSTHGTRNTMNGISARPDVAAYASSDGKAGDWIVYESTPEAVAGWVPGVKSFDELESGDKMSTTSHPGTTTPDTGYLQQVHPATQLGWAKGAVDRTTNANYESLFYMGRTHGDDKTTQWANYGKYPATISGGLVPVDAKLDYSNEEQWINWNADLFDAWYGNKDDVVAMHGCKSPYLDSSSQEYIDRYYRMRLAGYGNADSDIESPVSGPGGGWDDENDGSLAIGGGFRMEYVDADKPGYSYPKQPVEPTVADLGGSSGAGIDTGVTDWDGAAYTGGDDYQFVRKLSDSLMWWAEARAIGQVSRILAREYTLKWEGSTDTGMANSHSKMGSAVHYAYKMMSDTWSTDNKGSGSILDLWYEDMNNAPLQDWWKTFYRNYCNTGSIGFGGIAECATSWAWLQGHKDDPYLVHDTGPRLGGGQYMKTYCTELYIAVKDILEPIPNAEPMPGLYSSCDRGVCTAVHAAGADDNFPWGAARHQYDYAMSSGLWEDLGLVSGSSFDMLEPGDLLLSSHHVIVFVGGEYAAEKWPNDVTEESGKNGIVHSSLSSDLDSSRGPRYDLDGTFVISMTNDYHAFRLKGEPDESSPCKAALEAAESDLAGKNDGSF